MKGKDKFKSGKTKWHQVSVMLRLQFSCTGKEAGIPVLAYDEFYGLPGDTTTVISNCGLYPNVTAAVMQTMGRRNISTVAMAIIPKIQ